MARVPSQSSDLAPGAIIAGKYRVERVIGSGGMGIVAAARHLELGTRVAIKVLRAGAVDAGEALERFSREARAASRLRGEHVARVFDVGKAPDGMPYMVMEYLEGEDLDALVGQGVGVGVLVGYLLQVCEAVAEAHSVGIVHRDLKPRNLFLTRRIDGAPLVKVLDFGIAKRVSAGTASAALTGTLSIVGSPPYMSPEQMRASRDVDERSDVWSLGVCLYELTTGVLPFDGETAVDICAAALKHEPRRPDDVSPAVPRELADVVMRCLRKDPADRFPDVGVLAEALEPFAPPSERGAAARIRQVLQAPTEPWAPPEPRPVLELVASDTRTAASLDSQSSRKKRARSGAWIALGAVVLAAATTVLVARRATTSARTEPRPAPVPGGEARSVAPSGEGPESAPQASAAELTLPPFELRSSKRGKAVRATPPESAPLLPVTVAAAPTQPPAEPPTAAASPPAGAPATPPAASPPPFALESAHVQIGPATGTVGTTASNVNRALGGLGGRATSCYRDALPRMSAPFDGVGVLHVETDDEGVIIEARFDGPMSGAVGACIAAAARGRQVPNVDTGRVRADIRVTFTAR